MLYFCVFIIPDNFSGILFSRLFNRPLIMVRYLSSRDHSLSCSVWEIYVEFLLIAVMKYHLKLSLVPIRIYVFMKEEMYLTWEVSRRYLNTLLHDILCISR